MTFELFGARATLWSALALTVVTALWLTGCAEEAPDMEVSYAFDSSCLDDPAAVASAAEGFAQWQDFGLTIMEASAAADVTVCLVHRAALPNHAGGWTWGRRIAINVDNMDLLAGWRVTQVAAHEMGHAILFSGEHLAPGDRGIMSAQTYYGEGGGPFWSPADEIFITARL